MHNFPLLLCVLVAFEALEMVSAFASPLAFPEGEGPDGTKYKTAYSCEGDELSISCDSRNNELIHVIRANYGRFSIAICNSHGYTDWSVNCMAPRTKRVLKNKCDGKERCRMPVNSNIFGDPCPETHKYVEVHYACSPQHLSTTKKPLPPWFLESNAGQLWNPHREVPGPQRADEFSSETSSTGETISQTTAKTTPKRKPILVTRPTTVTTTTVTTTTPTTTTSSSTSRTETATPTMARIPITTPSSSSSDVASKPVIDENSASRNNNNNNGNNVKDHVVQDLTHLYPEVEVIVSDIPFPSNNNQEEEADFGGLGFCKPTFSRNIKWNWTREGEVAIVPCPIGATGLARWSCSNNPLPPFIGEWQGPQPDLSDCKSSSMTSLETKVRMEDPENVIVSTLTKLTSGHYMYGGDLDTATSVMTTVANRIQYLLQTQSDSFYRKEAYIQEVLQNIIRSASNILSQNQRPAWNDLHTSSQMKIATSLLLSLEENAFLLAEVLKQEEVVEEASREIVMSIHVVDTKKAEADLTFPSETLSRTRPYSRVFGSIGDSITLPAKSMKRNSDHKGMARAVFFSHKSLNEILGKSEVSLTENDSSVEKKRSRRKLVLNSRIISASLAKGRHVEMLDKPVEIKLHHLRTENMSEPICVYWDFELAAWSDAGCRVTNTAESFTVCECNHLTNFALLMEVDDGSGETESVVLVVLQVLCYFAVAAALLVLIFICIKFRTKLHKLLYKLGCLSDEKKMVVGGGGGIQQNCPKSQSFYSGVNLVTLAGNGNTHHKVEINGGGRAESNNRVSPVVVPNQFVAINQESAQQQHQRLSQMLIQRHIDAATLKLSNNQNNGHINQALYGDSINNYSVLEQPDGMEATKQLRDSVYMSPQLVNLTNTLRSKKKCQGGHQNDCTVLPENEVVFRAVSPHGHVYWEIDPKANVMSISDEDERTANGHVSTATSSSEMSSSRQSSSRYSDSHPLITDSPQHQYHQQHQQQQQQHVLVNPFADVQLLSSASASSSPISAVATRKNNDFRFSSLRLGPKKNQNMASHFATRKNSKKDDIIPEQVQIKDIRSIPVSVKSNDYILAKIQSHMNRGSPVDLVATTTVLNGNNRAKQRKV